MEDLPEKPSETEIQNKLLNSLREKIGKVYDWIDNTEGRIISKTIASLGSFVVGDPTGMIFPLILECSDYAVRKRFVKHFPDLMKKIQQSKEKINLEFLQSELGQKLLKDTLKQIISQDDEEKIEIQKNFLLNSLTFNEPNQEKIRTFQTILISLEPTQLRILGALANSKNTVSEFMKMKDKFKPTIKLEVKEDFKKFLHIDEELFERSLLILESEGLATRKNIEVPWLAGEYDWQYSKEAIQRMEDVLDRVITKLGKNFVEYIQDSN